MSPKSDLAAGKFVVDAKSYAVHLAKCWKTVSARGMPQIIARAAAENDIVFFNRLVRALGKKEPEPAVNWSKPDATASFLSQNWCQTSDFSHWLSA